MNQPGKIILLNGASSSGKTSLLREIQRTCCEPYLDLGLDRFLWMMPKRYLDRPLWDDVLGKADHAGMTGKRLVSAMHYAIQAVARQGMNVVADHVLVEPGWVRECAQLFCNLPAWLVGLCCPLPVLEQRERERKDRTLGQARLQVDLVHAHSVYDLELDTAELGPEACAEKIFTHIENGRQPTAFKKLYRGRKSL